MHIYNTACIDRVVEEKQILKKLAENHIAIVESFQVDKQRYQYSALIENCKQLVLAGYLDNPFSLYIVDNQETML